MERKTLVVTRSACLSTCVIAVLLSAGSLMAKVPEPDTVLCGTLAQVDGSGVQSTALRKLQVQAVVDGAVLAVADVSSTTNTFVLRIPMDDGVSPRIPGTAKSSDRVRVRVVNTTEGTVVETQETQVNAIEIPSERGSVIAVDFRVDGTVMGDDLDGDGLPDVWERQYAVSRFAGVAPLSLAEKDSVSDNDGDGYSNWEEFVAGTDPLDKSSVFSIRRMDVGTDTVSLSFGPVTEDRIYSLLYKADLGLKDWTVIDQYRPVEAQDEISWEAATGGGNGGFYRLRVEMAQ